MEDTKTHHVNGNDQTKNYKLIYFDVRGRGEIPRLLFHAAGVPFTDKRIVEVDKWVKHLKPSKYDRKYTVFEQNIATRSLTVCTRFTKLVINFS